MPKLKFQYVRQHVTETLLEFLVRRFRYHDAAAWEERIAGGHVTVDGRVVAPTHLLETRERILYDRPPGPEPEIDPRYSVLFEDAHVLAVSKSGNIPTSPSGKYWDNCLVHLLQRERNEPWLHAVHRLDRETSGINLFAKDKSVARALGEDFRAGRVYKAYTAVVEGRFPTGTSLVSAPLRNSTTAAVRIRQEAHPEGRPAQTRFTLERHLAVADHPRSVLRAEPLTGRTHQIRAHAALIGFPVCNDKLYGQPDESFLRWLEKEPRHGGDRHLLHSSELSFVHPITKRTVELRDGSDGLFVGL